MDRSNLFLPTSRSGCNDLSLALQLPVTQVRHMQRLQTLGSFAATGLVEINQLLTDRELLVLEIIERKVVNLPEKQRDQVYQLYLDFANALVILEGWAGERINDHINRAKRR